MKPIFLTVAALSVSVFHCQILFAQVEEILKFIPNDSNAIAIINVESIYGSQMAASEKWIENSKLKYANSPLYFPTSTRNVILAAEMDLTAGVLLSESAYLNMKNPIEMDLVAKLVNGSKEKLSGFECVDTPGGATLIKLGYNTLATQFPANRQQIGRWAKAVKDKQTGKLSPYLASVAERGKQSDAEILMAIELTYVVRPNMLREVIERGKWKSQNHDLMRVITSLQGVTFEVRLKSEAQGILRVDFAEDVSSISGDAKELIGRALKDKGLYIKDLDNWVVDAKDKQLTMKGRLTTNGLRRVASIIEPPRIPISAMDMGEKVDKGRAKAIATQEHWDAVQALLKDIRNYQPQTRNQLSFYYERYGRKIDNLPILNVDELELDYAAQVANTLRGVALGRRSVVAQTAATDKQYRGYNYGWGAHGWQSTGAASTAASAGVVARGAVSKATSMQGLDTLTAQVRRALTEKYAEYQLEFSIR